MLFEEDTRIHEARELVLAGRLEAELGIAEGEFDVLKGTWEDAKEAKDTYDTEEARLKKVRSDMDTDDTKTDADKNAADQAIQDHEDTKQGIYDAEDQAKQARDQKRQQITDAATLRDDLAY